MPTDLEADYLIVGAGAMGMAFADTLVAETEASVVMVDRHAKPGGHWNLAYPFVTLHQPSSFYGVGSRELSRGQEDQVGLNRGLGELASGAEVSAYFEAVMRHDLLPTGRVRYVPLCEYAGDGAFTSTLTGEEHHVSAARTVNATHLTAAVPSDHTPSFSVDPAARLVPPNALPTLREAPTRFVVIGGGKTGVDACLWLLEHDVDPARISWVVSRDAWMLDRRNTQSSAPFFADTVGAMAGQFEAIAAAESVEDMFDRLEACGYLLRLDPDVRPSMFHAATISRAELEELGRIDDVVRLGRVRALEPDRIVLDGGELPSGPEVLHVDCSASAIKNRMTKPIFAQDTITPQTVSSFQPAFSASLIAHVETAYASDEEKNRLCGVVPLPDGEREFLAMTAMFMANRRAWSQEPGLQAWVLQSRLDPCGKLAMTAGPEDHDKLALLGRMGAAAAPAFAKLQQFLSEVPQEATAHG